MVQYLLPTTAYLSSLGSRKLPHPSTCLTNNLRISMISSLVAWLYLLKDLGLDIHYSVSQFMWDNITVDIVPNGIQLELIPGCKPFYRKPFSIPKAYQQVTKDEIAQLERIGLLTKVTASKGAAPTFIIPKKKQTVHIITDFRGLNKCLK